MPLAPSLISNIAINGEEIMKLHKFSMRSVELTPKRAATFKGTTTTVKINCIAIINAFPKRAITFSRSHPKIPPLKTPLIFVVIDHSFFSSKALIAKSSHTSIPSYKPGIFHNFPQAVNILLFFLRLLQKLSSSTFVL